MMNRITEIKYTTFDTSLKQPLNVTLGVINSISSVLIKILTEEGICGIGEAAPFAPVTGENIDTVISTLKLFEKALIGMDSFDIEGIHKKMDTIIAHNTSVKCGIDIALHDILGKTVGLPLYRVLGGSCPTVINDITIGINEPEKMAEDALEAVKDGFSILKVKTGIDPQNDIRALNLIRELVGDNIVIRVDANQGYNIPVAVSTINAMRHLNISAVEQCLPDWDIEGAALLRNQLPGIRMMLDESIHSPIDAMRASKIGAADVFNIKLMKCGGLFHAKKINSIAESSGINCMIGCMLETKIGITAGLSCVAAHSNITEADCDSFLLSSDPDMGMKGGFTRHGGQLTLLEEPGLGLEVDF